MKKVLIMAIVGIIILCFNYPDHIDDIIGTSIHLALAGLIIFTIIRCLIIDPINKKREEKFQNQRIKEAEEKKSQLLNSFNFPLSNIYNYGHCKYILVSELEKKIMLEEMVFDFKQIKDCVLMDDSETVYSSTTKREGSNTGSVIGRTVVGKIFLGNAGAIVGGLTADKTTTTSEQTVKERHDFTIKIALDSFTKPIVRIPLGNDVALTDEIYALFNVIISHK